MEKMRAKFSKMATASCSSLALINCNQKKGESLTLFIYRWGELLIQCCGMTTEQCRDKLKTDLFLSQCLNKKLPKESLENTQNCSTHLLYCVRRRKRTTDY